MRGASVRAGFNGSAADRRWREGRGYSRALDAACFNGSAADRRRRGPQEPAKRSALVLSMQPASTGPPLIGDGETHARPLECSRCRGFNGSAADRRRRGHRRGRHGDDLGASTGPPLIGDGERLNVATTRRWIDSFNGSAADRRRRERAAAARRASSAARFNGSAADRRRRAARHGRAKLLVVGASTGPPLIGDGETTTCTCTPCPAMSFNGSAADRRRRAMPAPLRHTLSPGLQRVRR